jgi:hypothetical protein
MYRTNGGVAVSPSYATQEWFEVDVVNSAPRIDNVTPDQGPSTEETQITITGANFGSTQGTGFVFCKQTRAARYVSWSDTQIVCLLGLHPSYDGVSDLVVVRDSGQSGVLVNAFTAIAAPYFSFSPSTVSVYGGNTIKIYGANFLALRGSGSVTIGGTALESYTTWTDTYIEGITPGHLTAGNVTITVTNSLSQSASATLVASSSATLVARLYLDPDAAGSGNGYYWEDAFTSTSAAIAAVNPGQIIYARGTESLSARISFTGKDGAVGKYIRLIGCNASGVDDGTHFELAFQNILAASSYLFTNDGAYWLYKNFKITNTGTETAGAQLAGSTQCIVINCDLTGLTLVHSGGIGIYYKSQFGNLAFRGCALFCKLTNNTAQVMATYSNPGIYYCLLKGRLVFSTGNFLIYNSVLDGGNYDAIWSNNNAYNPSVFGCRITNNSGYAKNATNFLDTFVACFIDNNSSGGINSPNAVYVDTTETLFTGVQGYVDSANSNYNLAINASLRNTPVTIGAPCANGVNKYHFSAGFNPVLNPEIKTKPYVPRHIGVWSQRG